MWKDKRDIMRIPAGRKERPLHHPATYSAEEACTASIRESDIAVAVHL